MSKERKRNAVFFLTAYLYVLGFTRAVLKTRLVRYVLGPLVVFLFLVTTWHLRMWLSILRLVFRDAARYYVGVFWPALFSLLKGYLYMPLWLGFGDLLYKWRIALLYYFYYRPLLMHNEWRHWDKRWYWRDNPAMWMADLMWEDLVKFYEKLWFWYFYHLYTTKRRMENFADYPYTHMWWLIKFIWSRISIYRSSGRFYRLLSRVFTRLRLRNYVLLESFKLKLYLGLSGEEYRTGRIQGLLDYPKIFDFKKLKVVARDNYVVLPERWK